MFSCRIGKIRDWTDSRAVFCGGGPNLLATLGVPAATDYLTVARDEEGVEGGSNTPDDTAL